MELYEPAYVAKWQSAFDALGLPAGLNLVRVTRNDPAETGMAGDYPVVWWRMSHEGKQYGTFAMLSETEPDMGLAAAVLEQLADKAQQTREAVSGQDDSA